MTRQIRIVCLLSLLCCCGIRAAYSQAKPDSDELMRRIRKAIEVDKDYATALRLSKSGADRFPNDADFNFLLGRSYLLNNQPEKAQQQIDKVIGKAPAYKDAYLLSANIQMVRNKGYNAVRYLDLGLRRFPNDPAFRVKKMNIYEAIGDANAADLQADTIRRFLYRDAAAIRAYRTYHLDAADRLLKTGSNNLAIAHYEKVLELAPRDTAARSGIIAAKSRSGDLQGNLDEIRRLLQKEPGSYTLQMKQLSLLQDMRRYPEALDVLAAIRKQYPGDAKAQALETELRLEAARFYKNSDPYYQYLDVLEHSPGNREALDNVISMAMSRGMYDEALLRINAALKRNPGDKLLLTRKMSILEQQGKYASAAGIAANLSRSGAGMGTYVDLQLLAARDFAAQQQPDSALAAYNKVLAAEPRNRVALNGATGMLTLQKHYEAAAEMLDRTIAYYPSDYSLQIRKAALLQEDGQYTAAVEVLERLQEDHPGTAGLAPALREAWLVSGRQQMQQMDYDAAATTYNKLLALYPDDRDALTNLINIELTRGGDGYSAALSRSDSALVHYPNDKEFLLKRSESLIGLKRYTDAWMVTEALQTRYPYNTPIRIAYQDQLMAAATERRNAGDTAAAVALYRKVLAVAPSDTVAWLGLINIYTGGQQYAQALDASEQALSRHPQQPVFMIKKAAALEALGRYREATMPVDTIAKLYPDRLHYQDYLAYLRSRTYHNQIGIAYLNARLDSVQAANIATLQYMRYGKAGSLALRLNFAGRSIGTGLQLELESYINHGKKWYSFVNVGAANEIVFPKYKANYSIFHNLGRGWEAELGGRFLNFDSINTVSGVASLAKYLGDFWINARGYVITVSDKQYYAATVTARQYLNNKTDFFYTVLGYGNSPDDFSRSFQLDKIIDYTTYSIGAGYRKMFNHRNIVSINGTWYNQRLTESRYRNQYDIYLTFYRNF